MIIITGSKHPFYLRCFFGIHTGTWHTGQKEIPLINEKENKWVIGIVKTEHRFCGRCGDEQYRETLLKIEE